MITLEYLSDGCTYIIGAKSHQEIDYVQGYSKPNYPMPAIRTELDYYRDWPTNNVVAVVLFNVSDPNIPCLEFWH